MCNIKARLTAGFLFLVTCLSGCAIVLPQTSALQDNPPTDLPRALELTAVPFFPQEEYQCGPAALATVLNAAGVSVTPEALINQVYIPARKGSLQIEMLATARRHGLVAYQLSPKLENVLREIAAGTPVIVLENYGFRIYPIWHYAVLVGYDLEKREVIRRSGTKQRQTMPLEVFEYVWKDEGYWAMVAVPPHHVPATADESAYADSVVALERLGHTKNARTAYAAMQKRWPTNLVAQLGLGNTAYALGDTAEAEASFRRAAADHPDSVSALNNLAHVLAERGALPEAYATAQRAVSLGGPLSSSAQTTLDEIRAKLPALKSTQ